MRPSLIFLLLFFTINLIYAQVDQVITVEAVDFYDPSPEGWCAQYKKIVEFPESDQQWGKIIMVQTLKCDEATKADTFLCGEWDYIWHTIINEPVGDTVEQYCIGSFVTPYGKRLKLGDTDGWTWYYDVTDYAPILKGEKEIITGNNQELLDLKFMFFPGKPIRDILSVENIYPFGKYLYEHLADDSLLKKRKIILDTDASGYMLRARISGHGHAGPRNCCEWDSKTHTYYINDGDKFRWNVWKDCGFNPIYPQGGTWPFDRAGWCPGTKVDEYDFELTPKVHSGDTIDFDYGIEYYSDNGEKDGDFQMTHQLFNYGPPNFKNDAALVEIIAPTDKDEHSRINPVCSNPVIIIKNTGEYPLKSLKIIYGLEKGIKSEYRWHGNLAFLEKEEVVLPVPDWSGWRSDLTFLVEIDQPNGKSDENELNNKITTLTEIPVNFPSEFIIHIKTNDLNRACENQTIISGVNGEIKFSFEAYEDDTDYYHEVKLEAGCHQFRFTDQLEDGVMLHWWYYNEDRSKMGKTGKIEILSKDKKEVLYKFSPDFGQELTLNFIVGKLP